MVCYDSGLVIHVTHLRNMLFICTLIFQKLDVNLQGCFFFFSFFWETETKLFSFLLHLLPGICSGSLSCVLRPQPWDKGKCPQTSAFRLPWENWACARQCFWNAPLPPQCSVVSACLLRTAVHADDPFLVAKEVTYVFYSPPFTGDVPKRKEGGYVVMKSDVFPSWILMDNLAPG